MSGFPCTVNPDSNSTTLNPWPWNANVNMLYVDQPVLTGFSYVSLQNGLVDLLTAGHDFTPVENPSAFVQTNLTTVGATSSTQDPTQMANTTAQAARTMWHFAQVWFQEYVRGLVRMPLPPDDIGFPSTRPPMTRLLYGLYRYVPLLDGL
jgi:Serine carboxypeptidase